MFSLKNFPLPSKTETCHCPFFGQTTHHHCCCNAAPMKAQLLYRSAKVMCIVSLSSCYFYVIKKLLTQGFQYSLNLCKSSIIDCFRYIISFLSCFQSKFLLFYYISFLIFTLVEQFNALSAAVTFCLASSTDFS